MPLIGTAGHVDHGKSTLIRALTGRDPDRWAEERRRGLTIDLGFAWATLPSGAEASFVDVPGHERYLKNMLAGIEAIDIALLVVAADEGWAPQSEEHLAVLDLLDVRIGVAALTKIDLVDPDLAELAELETAEKLAGASLEGAPVIRVSGATGEGVGELAGALGALASDAAPTDMGRPRLWVDRSFTASGSGTVVTGTLLEGGMRVGDRVRIYPGEGTARIRGIRSHERALAEVGPGRRVALNLAGVDRADAARGSMIGAPGDWAVSARLAVSLRPARYVERINRRGAYQLHIGSRAAPMAIIAEEGGAAIIATPEPIPAAVGDRFIVRDTGRRLVVAGGMILDPQPGATRAAMRAARAVDPSPDEAATQLIRVRGTAPAALIAAHTKGGSPRGARLIGDLLVANDVFDERLTAAEKIVEAEHERRPLRVGAPLATLAAHLGVDPAVAEALVAASGRLERVGPDVVLAGRKVGLGPSDEVKWEKVRARLAEDLAVPAVDELKMGPDLLHHQVRTGELVRVSESLVFLKAQIALLRETVEAMPPGFTVADFRDATGLSRKYAVPLLEWADEEGLTTRRGDARDAR